MANRTARVIFYILFNFSADVPDGFIPDHITKASEEQKRNWLHKEVAQIVDKFVIFRDITDIVSGVTDPGSDLPTQNKVNCRATGCNKEFKYPKARNNHEKREHGLSVSPKMVTDADSGTVMADHKKQHTEARLGFGFFLANIQDAVKEGDGERLMHLYKVALMLFKAYGHTQYAYSTLLLTLQVNFTLSPRLAHSLMWNRFWNGKGGIGRNISLDLHLEHLNNFLKSFLKRSGPNITEKSADRVSKSIGILQKMMEDTDRELQVSKSTGAHHAVGHTEDVLVLLEVFKEAELFKDHPGREFSAFPRFSCDLLKTQKLKSINLKGWIIAKLQEWQKNPI